MSVAKLMIPVLLVPSLAMAGTSYDRAKVVGVDPVYETVTYRVPVEQCRLEQVPVSYDTPRSPYRSYTGPIVGAIIGGAIGNAVGHNKTNKKVGTAVGAVLGGTIGRDISNRNAASREGDYYRQPVSYRTEEVCETVQESRQEMQLSGYDVTYRYAGELFTTRMDHDPGKYLRVRVHVTPA
ncbi:MAG: glycine zipper 2TM domain-containing protein [Pseudomonadales bacterium]